MKDEWKALLERLDALVGHLERLAPPAAREPDWKAARAFRWRKGSKGGYLESIRHPHSIRFSLTKRSPALSPSPNNTYSRLNECMPV